jgi:FMN reductase
MSYFLLITGSPNKISKASFALEHIENWLDTHSYERKTIHARELPTEDLVFTRIGSRHIVSWFESIYRASAVILLTPVVKGTDGGLLKSFLDLLPPFALAGKPVLLVSTGGFPGHSTAILENLRPVLENLGANPSPLDVQIASQDWLFSETALPLLTPTIAQNLVHGLEKLDVLSRKNSLAGLAA